MPGDAGAPFSFVDRQWRWWTALFWLCLAGYMVFDNWARIRGFGLGDTDDNMRMMQVRGLLTGQGWYDLAQHRLMLFNQLLHLYPVRRAAGARLPFEAERLMPAIGLGKKRNAYAG